VLLSDHDIKAELASGRVKLDPYAPELIPPLSIDIRLDRYFRVFENHRYPHIDPAVEQPELTRLVETGEGDHPSSCIQTSSCWPPPMRSSAGWIDPGIATQPIML
jgi:deoxycytidine triphosphate deaminase